MWNNRTILIFVRLRDIWFLKQYKRKMLYKQCDMYYRYIKYIWRLFNDIYIWTFNYIYYWFSIFLCCYKYQNKGLLLFYTACSYIQSIYDRTYVYIVYTLVYFVLVQPVENETSPMSCSLTVRGPSVSL